MPLGRGVMSMAPSVMGGREEESAGDVVDGGRGGIGAGEAGGVLPSTVAVECVARSGRGTEGMAP